MAVLYIYANKACVLWILASNNPHCSSFRTLLLLLIAETALICTPLCYALILYLAQMFMRPIGSKGHLVFAMCQHGIAAGKVPSCTQANKSYNGNVPGSIDLVIFISESLRQLLPWRCPDPLWSEIWVSPKAPQLPSFLPHGLLDKCHLLVHTGFLFRVNRLGAWMQSKLDKAILHCLFSLLTADHKMAQMKRCLDDRNWFLITGSISMTRIWKSKISKWNPQLIGHISSILWCQRGGGFWIRGYDPVIIFCPSPPSSGGRGWNRGRNATEKWVGRTPLYLSNNPAMRKMTVKMCSKCIKPLLWKRMGRHHMIYLYIYMCNSPLKYIQCTYVCI